MSNHRRKQRKEQKRIDKYAKLKRMKRATAAKERRLEKSRLESDKLLNDRLDLIGPPEVIDLPKEDNEPDKPDVFNRSDWGE